MSGYTLVMYPDWSKITTEVLDMGINMSLDGCLFVVSLVCLHHTTIWMFSCILSLLITTDDML